MVTVSFLLVVIDGSEAFDGIGPNPKTAQHEAARKALSFIISFGNRLSIHPTRKPPGESSSLAIRSTRLATNTSVSDLNRLKPGTPVNIIKAGGYYPPNLKFTAKGFIYNFSFIEDIFTKSSLYLLVVVNGRSYFGTGPRKRDARNEAARKAKSSLVEDQLKNQQKIKEKIGELKKIRADLKCRLKNLKAQSKRL